MGVGEGCGGGACGAWSVLCVCFCVCVCGGVVSRLNWVNRRELGAFLSFLGEQDARVIHVDSPPNLTGR